jgi:outer membrane immunogenic protein
MRRILIASSLTLALASGSALAADMGTPVYKAPSPPPPPAMSWTGCYVDAGWGYGLYDQTHQSIDIPGSGALLSGQSNTAGEGWLGRFGGGCDYQFSLGNLGNFVLGVLADYDLEDIHGIFENTFSGAGGGERESGSWAAGGRIGYLVTPNLLTYWDGGYTQTRFDQINLGDIFFFPPGVVFAYAPATTYSGWFIGGGTEYALNFSWLPIPGLFWRNEYRFSRYNSQNVQEYFLDGVPGTGDIMQKDVQTVTSSLVWKFNWTGH